MKVCEGQVITDDSRNWGYGTTIRENHKLWDSDKNQKLRNHPASHNHKLFNCDSQRRTARYAQVYKFLLITSYDESCARRIKRFMLSITTNLRRYCCRKRNQLSLVYCIAFQQLTSSVDRNFRFLAHNIKTILWRTILELAVLLTILFTQFKDTRIMEHESCFPLGFCCPQIKRFTTLHDNVMKMALISCMY